MKVLVSGASGFVGRALCMELALQHEVYGTTRHPDTVLPTGVSTVFFDGAAEMLDSIPDIDVVVHLAARVHVMAEHAANPLETFRHANVEMTQRLAQWAIARRVKRFILLSSIKVNGEATLPGQAFSEDDVPAPEDAYAVSKLEAEQALRSLCDGSHMEFVVIRPPLVYGPGVQGNFATMVRWVKRNLPLPLGAISNRRSLVALDNLVSFIETCLGHPAAANQIFLVSDGEPVSTTDLLRRIARALDVRLRLLPVPPDGLRFAASIFGRAAMADRLLGSLVMDNEKGRRLLGWHPPVTMDEQLRKLAQYDARF